MAEMAEDFDREIKVLVIGNGGVGKTSMIRRFCKGVFTDEYKKTIGVDFLEKAQFVDALQEEVRFMLWDTAGQEEFDAITRTYYRGAGAAVLAFSTTDRLSFDAIATWKGKVENECGDIAMCLVQNKVDLIDQAVADAEEVEALARKLGLRLYRTCVKQNVNVAEVFVYLAELHQRKLAAGQLNSQPATPAINNMGGSGGGGGGGGPFSGGSAFGTPAAQAGGGSGVEEVGQEDGAEADTAAGPPPPVPAVPAAPAQAPQARTVNVGPSKVRTGGKKSFKEKLTKCSLA